MRQSLLSGRTWLMAAVAATKEDLAVRDTHIVMLTPEAFMPPAFFYEDRFAAVETALMKQAGITTFIATSSGNTGSALAAFSAKHGLRCLLFVNEIAPVNKLKQMLIRDNLQPFKKWGLML